MLIEILKYSAFVQFITESILNGQRYANSMSGIVSICPIPPNRSTLYHDLIAVAILAMCDHLSWNTCTQLIAFYGAHVRDSGNFQPCQVVITFQISVEVDESTMK